MESKVNKIRAFLSNISKISDDNELSAGPIFFDSKSFTNSQFKEPISVPRPAATTEINKTFLINTVRNIHSHNTNEVGLFAVQPS